VTALSYKLAPDRSKQGMVFQLLDRSVLLLVRKEHANYEAYSQLLIVSILDWRIQKCLPYLNLSSRALCETKEDGWVRVRKS